MKFQVRNCKASESSFAPTSICRSMRKVRSQTSFRAKQGWATIAYLATEGAKVIVVSHLGRDPEESMEPVAQALKKAGFPVFFVPDITGQIARHAVETMQNGDVALLDNIRRDERETKNDESLAKELASLADVYVDDAFATAHREHASIVGVPKFLPHYAGLLMRDEVRELTKALKPQSPSFAILGGAKFETKAPLIKRLLETYDHLFITGALANDVFKARGLPVGVSLISKELPGEDVLKHPHFLAPVDVTVLGADGQSRMKKPEEVLPDEKIVDIGPDSVALIAPLIAEAKCILWNGPTGMYEAGYNAYTDAIGNLLTKSSAERLIGGGDTIAALEAGHIPQEKLGFLSTGGGAMLEFLLKGTLPALDALA
jgi:phosphoglycerate kinase